MSAKVSPSLKSHLQILTGQQAKIMSKMWQNSLIIKSLKLTYKTQSLRIKNKHKLCFWRILSRATCKRSKPPEFHSSTTKRSLRKSSSNVKFKNKSKLSTLELLRVRNLKSLTRQIIQIKLSEYMISTGSMFERTLRSISKKWWCRWMIHPSRTSQYPAAAPTAN